MDNAKPALNALYARRTKLERWGESGASVEFSRKVREVRRVRWVGLDARNGRVLAVFGYWHVVSIAYDAWTTQNRH
jgi:hypothetical protein